MMTAGYVHAVLGLGPAWPRGLKYISAIFLHIVWRENMKNKKNQKETDVPRLCAIVVRGQSGKPRPPMFIKMFHAVMYRGFFFQAGTSSEVLRCATCLDEEVTLEPGKTLVAGGPQRPPPTSLVGALEPMSRLCKLATKQ